MRGVVEIKSEIIINAVNSVCELDDLSMQIARHKFSCLAGQGGFGVIEDIAVRLAGIFKGEPIPGDGVIVVMAGDHGIAREDRDFYSDGATLKMAKAFLSGEAPASAAVKAVGAKAVVVDMGIDGEILPCEILYSFKIRNGTMDISKGPAMTFKEAARSIEAGIEVAAKVVDSGAGVIGAAEIGAGGVLSAYAILSVMTGLKAEKVIGTAAKTRKYARKTELIEKAVNVNLPNPGDPVEVLAKVGGLEIGGLVGLIIGAASRGVPVIIDGFVTGAAAMLAFEMCPCVRDYMFFSHASAEPGHGIMLEWMDFQPCLHLDMEAGGGIGAALMLPLINAASKIYHEAVLQKEERLDALSYDYFWKRKF